MVLIFPFTFTALLKILRKQLLFIKYFLVLFILSESHHFDMLWLYEPSRHKRPMSLIRKWRWIKTNKIVNCHDRLFFKPALIDPEGIPNKNYENKKLHSTQNALQIIFKKRTLKRCLLSMNIAHSSCVLTNSNPPFCPKTLLTCWVIINCICSTVW